MVVGSLPVEPPFHPLLLYILYIWMFNSCSWTCIPTERSPPCLHVHNSLLLLTSCKGTRGGLLFYFSFSFLIYDINFKLVLFHVDHPDSYLIL